MKNYLTVFFCFVFLYSCKTEKQCDELLHVKVEQMQMSDLVSDYSIIALETLDDNLILDPTVVKFTEKYIFILDRFSPSKSLYVFDHKGKYVGKVGSKGEGPGEYIMPHQFIVSEERGELYLRDMATNSILVYSLKNFGFVKKMSIPFYATCFDLLNNEHFIWYVNAGLQNEGDFRKHIQITDMDCNPVSSFMDVMGMPQRGMYNVMSYFEKHDNDVFFHHPFSGDYYSCSMENSEVLEFAYSLKFEGKPFPELEYIMEHRDNIVKDLEAERYIQWCDVLKNSSTYLSYWGSGKEIYWGRYDLETDKGWYVKRSELKDDLGIGNLSRPKTIFHDKFVSFISMENIEWDSLSNNSILKKHLKKEDVGGNPAILLYN
jgi:hypothetical protein